MDNITLESIMNPATKMWQEISDVFTHPVLIFFYLTFHDQQSYFFLITLYALFQDKNISWMNLEHLNIRLTVAK